MSEDHTGYRVPLRLTLLSIAALWSCYFVVATLRGIALGFDFSVSILIARLVIVALSMATLAALIPLVRCLHRVGPAVRLGAVLIGALPVALMLAGINNAVFHIAETAKSEAAQTTTVHIRAGESGDAGDDWAGGLDVVTDEGADAASGEPATIRIVRGHVDELSRPGNREKIWMALAEVGFGRYFLVLAWAATYFALVKGEEARLAERREGEYRRAAANAEVRSLRYQVNPHFLFNTLNSLSALVMTQKPEQAEQMIQTLSTYYRRTLSADTTGDVTLADEIALQRLYLEIEAVRFPDRLRTRIELPDPLGEAMVPGMILQPLIENSVKYAVAACQEPVTIAVIAREQAGCLVVTVCDNGPMTDTGDPHGCGIGLGNVRDRLRARFGEDATLEFGPRGEGGFETTITMPLLRQT